ncbi:phosphatidylinositol N-acetylglucosaminyltransferase subunit H isoform X2 [Microtus ochrogaster]|uniref:Phosphatidylinositol N-acetylglucosaminyltransferase subunit H isoform X2 n=1 Tax=Microtus ochrogaster TaxID=79684 RepID=A0ABM1U0N9_MICOH|nr:phosphatidylinositol N-acetylglucosaminyltransferase subunit H isoform X2 [Microtus ochrogaster]
MEDEKSFSDICGGRVVLRRRYYSPYCREFGLSSARLSLRSLTAVTCAVWLAAYGLFTLCENSMILSAAIFITIIGLLGYLHFVKIDQETLLIIDSLGIQMTSSYASGKESTTFIEMDKVKDVIINEAIYMKVIYYLCILLKDPGKPHEISQVVPVFQGYSEVLQASLYLKPWGEREDRYPFFETFSNLPGQWHSIYNTTVLLLHGPCEHLCTYTDTHKGWRYSLGGRSILSIVQGPGLVPSISPKLNRRLTLLRKIEK